MITIPTFPIKPGQTVYAIGTGNAAGRDMLPRTYEFTIVKIARQYFYAEDSGRWEYKFDKTTFEYKAKDGENAGFFLFESKEAMIRWQNAKIMNREIHRYFTSWNEDTPIDIIEQIYKILTDNNLINSVFLRKEIHI